MLSHFQLDENYTNLNHGSFGVVPKVVAETHFKMLSHVERNPDKFFRSEVKNFIVNYVNLYAEIIFYLYFNYL